MQSDESSHGTSIYFAMAYNACYVASQELLQDHLQQGFLNVTEGFFQGYTFKLLIQITAILCVRMAHIVVSFALKCWSSNIGVLGNCPITSVFLDLAFNSQAFKRHRRGSDEPIEEQIPGYIIYSVLWWFSSTSTLANFLATLQSSCNAQMNLC